MRLLPSCLACAAALAASDWPCFRRPNGSGISPDRDLPAEISRDRNAVWKTKTLKGNSSPVVMRGRLWITGYEGDDRVTLCYDAGSGELRRRRGVTKAPTETPNPLNGPTTPPAARRSSW